MSHKLTIMEVLGRKDFFNRIYVVWGLVNGNKAVVKVGKAKQQSVAQRMCEHIKSSISNNPSVFAADLFQNHPGYFHWVVEIYTLQECAAILNQSFKTLDQAESAMGAYYKVPIRQRQTKRFRIVNDAEQSAAADRPRE